jgi:hypothetical protein
MHRLSTFKCTFCGATTQTDRIMPSDWTRIELHTNQKNLYLIACAETKMADIIARIKDALK